MATLKGLATRLQRRANAIQDGAVEAKRILALKTLQKLITPTPVDTSLAVSNWRVSFGADIPRSIIPPPYPGILGSTAAQAKTYAWTTGSAAINARLKLKKGSRIGGAGESVRIFNPVHYVMKLSRSPTRRNWHVMGWVTDAPRAALRESAIEWKAKGVFRGRTR